MESQPKKDNSDSVSDSTSKKKSKKSAPELFIYKLDWFPITTSPWIASFSFFFHILFIIHFFDFYSIHATQVHKGEPNLVLISNFITSDIGIISYISNSLLSLLILLSTFFSKNDQQGFKYIMGWLGSKLFPILRYLIEINLGIAAFFLQKNMYCSIFFFFAVLINIFVTFISQNYNLRKDYLCCKSMEFLLLKKVIIVLVYTINCIGYYSVGQNKFVLLSFACVHVLFSLILIIAYLSFGYYIYRHTISQVLQVLIIALYSSLSAGCLYDEILSIVEGQTELNRFIICSGIFFVFICLFFYSYWGRIKNVGTDKSQQNLTKKIYYTYCKLDNSAEDLNDDCEIRGIIRYHLRNACSNVECFVNSKENVFYDSKKNKLCYPEKLNQGKTSFAKFYIKCLYEEQLGFDQWRSPALILQYVEFMYMKLKNVYKVSFLLRILEEKFLTPFQKLQLTRIKRVMLEENQHLNEELYHGKLDIENMLNSEIKFEQIRSQLNKVLERNIEFWNYVQKNEINLSEMAHLMKPNFNLIDKINENWKFLVKYFEIQKIWKFYFVLYTLYIKNQKIKPQFLQYFGHSIHEDQIFTFENVYIDKTTEVEKLFNSKMLFDPNTCCIHVSPTVDKIIIKKVSRYFPKIFGYQENEVSQTPISILMVPCVEKFHQDLFTDWAGSGKSNNETAYSVKKIFPIDRDKYVVPCFKFYKQYLCENKELQYVAMLKKNKEEESTIILNSHYEIQGITAGLMKKWKIAHSTYERLLGMSMLILFPSLIDLMKESAGDEEQANDEFSKSAKSIKSDTMSENENGFRKRKQSILGGNLTKSNLKMKIYHDFDEIKNLYEEEKAKYEFFGNEKEDTKTILEIMDRIKDIIKTFILVRQINVQMDIKERIISDTHHFIQIYILESEELQKEGNSANSSVQENEDVVVEEVEAEEEDFSKFFQSSVNSQKISLVFSDNIFIKEENNYPVEMIEHVYSITVSVRIIFVFFFGLVLCNMFIEYNKYLQYHETILEMDSLIEFHLNSLILNNNYYSQILSDSRKTEIQDTTGELMTLKVDKYFRQSILDLNINKMDFYTRFNTTFPEYDQVDVIKKLFMNLIQINYSDNAQVTINSTAFLDYQSLILPSANTLLSRAEKNVHTSFNQKSYETETNNYIFYGIESILLILGFILILSKLLTISTSFQSLMEIFTQFSQVDLKKIKKYCFFIIKLFSNLGDKYHKLSSNDFQDEKQDNSQAMRSIENEENAPLTSTAHNFLKESDDPTNEKEEIANANLNKKVKKVIVGKELRNIKIKSIVLVVVFLIIYGTTSFALNIHISDATYKVKKFEEAGYEIFQYYSVMQIYFVAMKERHLFEDNFQLSRYEAIEQDIQKMKLLKQIDTASFPLDVTFPTKYNVILFDNFCLKYPQVLNNDAARIKECQDVAENNVQHGVQSFLFYLSAGVKEYLNSNSYELDMELVENIETGLDICDIYLKYLLETWKEEFTSEVSFMSQNIIIICSCLIIIQGIVYVFLIEIMIVGNLKEKFLFFRKIYESLMPDFIVTKEKIIKAKLIVEGIIKK